MSLFNYEIMRNQMRTEFIKYNQKNGQKFLLNLKFMFDENISDHVHFETVHFLTFHILKSIKEIMDEYKIS